MMRWLCRLFRHALSAKGGVTHMALDVNDGARWYFTEWKCSCGNVYVEHLGSEDGVNRCTKTISFQCPYDAEYCPYHGNHVGN